jgi:hypothetical protein
LIKGISEELRDRALAVKKAEHALEVMKSDLRSHAFRERTWVYVWREDYGDFKRYEGWLCEITHGVDVWFKYYTGSDVGSDDDPEERGCLGSTLFLNLEDGIARMRLEYAARLERIQKECKRREAYFAKCKETGQYYHRGGS